MEIVEYSNDRHFLENCWNGKVFATPKAKNSF